MKKYIIELQEDDFEEIKRNNTIEGYLGTVDWAIRNAVPLENEQKQKTVLKEIVGRQAATQALIEWYGELSYEEINGFSKILDKHMENNEKVYVEMCEKDEKYDKLKEAIGKIKEKIELYAIPDYVYHGCGGSQKIVELEDVLSAIDKYTEGLI